MDDAERVEVLGAGLEREGGAALGEVRRLDAEGVAKPGAGTSPAMIACISSRPLIGVGGVYQLRHATDGTACSCFMQLICSPVGERT